MDLEDRKHTREERKNIDLNTSLTTILARNNDDALTDDDDEDQAACTPGLDTGSQVVFMDISNTSSMMSSTPLLKRKKKRKQKSSSGKQDITHTVVIVGIIAGLSFSAGFALGQSRRQ